MIEAVRVELGPRSYDVIVGPGALDRLAAHLPPSGGGLACVTDARVDALLGERVRAALGAAGRPVATWCVVPRGERAKSMHRVERVCAQLAGGGLGRDGCLLCFGGGVVGDLGGFAAAIYQRGIASVQMPTTLLAQVDSSVGGKTGVNLPLGKNMVGAFHQPRAVLCDTLALQTLATRDLRSGLAEALKHGVIQDAVYFDLVVGRLRAALARDPEGLTDIVAGSCRIKAAVVTADERESSLRAILNFGHTVGHAVESVAGYGRYRHGEAVAVGMLAATRIAQRMGLCDADVYSTLEGALRRAGLPTSCPGLDADRLIDAMGRDKKRLAGGMRWVLPTRIGAVAVVDDVPDGLVREVVAGLTAAASP